jgi:cellulose synthase (UDP-forming)
MKPDPDNPADESSISNDFSHSCYHRVAVLLPVRDESAVLEGLIDSVARLDYPRDRLEILLLDDSSEEANSKLARDLVDSRSADGLNIRYLNRKSNQGFKADNLNYGADRTGAGFLAIFDADFRPPADFLLQTMPSFRDPNLGFLQTGISYENRDASFLTRFQAQELEHHQFLISGQSQAGNLVSLSGSSCIWRRECLNAMGGWHSASATEDVDLAYLAQKSGWKYAYLKDVYSTSLLPETIGAFRLQRERWGRGLIHNAFKHLGCLFQSNISLLKRLHAVAMMFSSLLLASIYLLFLLTIPLTVSGQFEGPGITLAALAFYLLVTVWAFANLTGTPEWDNFTGGLGRSLGRSKGMILGVLRRGYLYVALFLPMSLYYFIGGLRALKGQTNEFQRTPKGQAEDLEPGTALDTFLNLAEIFSLLYAVTSVITCLFSGNLVLLPVGLTGCLGFGLVLFQSSRDTQRSNRLVKGSILITGATGAIGSALAELYANVGITLHLHGRNSQKLEILAEKCRAKGAIAMTHPGNLADTQERSSWLSEIKQASLPDLILPAAGINISLDPIGGQEDRLAAEKLIELNVKGTLEVIAAFLPDLIQRGRGQITVFSSLAGYFGLPLTPSYCSSKAALKCYGESLRGSLKRYGLKVSVIMPGYVKSLMCDEMPGPKPFLITPDRAARIIRRGLERNRARISFPFPLNLGAWFLAVLPASVSHKILEKFGYAH